METRKRYLFTLNTSGSCFLCLKNVADKERPSKIRFGTENDCPSKRNFSIQNIARYLNIDLAEIISTNDFVVSLCDGCGGAVEEFSKFYEAMEVYRLRVEATLEVIRGRLSNNLKGYNDKEEYNSEIVGKLRQILIDKCNSKVTRLQPRINLAPVPASRKNPGKLQIRKRTQFEIAHTEDNLSDTPGKEHFVTSMEDLVKNEESIEDDEQIVHDDNTSDKESEQILPHIEVTSGLAPEPFEKPQTPPQQQLKLSKKGNLFVCTHCSKTYKTSTSLRDHLNSHGEGKLKCPYCPRIYNYQSRLDIHLVSHTKEKRFLCQFCSKAFQRNARLTAHLASKHSQESQQQASQQGKSPFVCTHCSKTFQSHTVFSHHLNLHGEGKLKCPYCPKKFHFQSKLDIHLASHTKEKRFLCQFCSKAFQRNALLTNHLARKHNHVVVKSKVSTECPTCRKILGSRNSLKYHMTIHTGEHLFKCSHCPMKFALKPRLNMHIRKEHPEERPFKCDECDMAFLYLAELRIHQRETHKENQEELNQNPDSEVNSVHSDPDPPPPKQLFNCQFCEQVFISNYGKDRHLTFCHPDKVLAHRKRKIYRKCPICGKGLSKTGFKYHMRLHTGEKFKCPHCPKGFTGRQNLLEHVRMHTGERPFKCPKCPQTFPYASYLKKHLDRHEGIKRFFCTKCGYGFYQKTELQRHVRKHPNCDTVPIDKTRIYNSLYKGPS